MNTFGNILKFTSFGESHGPAIGGVLDGFPAGFPIDISRVAQAMERRRPGQSAIVTQRNEPDSVEFLSGIFEGKSTGAPIAFIIRNKNQRSADYENLRHALRPSHADFTYQIKYGDSRDYRGGGRSSARETAARVAAGAIAMQYLNSLGITVTAYTSQVGHIKLETPYTELNLDATDSNPVRCPQSETALKMQQAIEQAKKEGDTLGGVATCVIKGCPAGLGEPLYGKLQAQLAAAMLGINAAKGFDYGMGFDGIASRGSQVADNFVVSDTGLRTFSNHSGGIQGGISNGEDIYFRVAFKPVATLLKPLDTFDIHGNPIHIDTRGRHDPCVLPRAVPVVEAMAALVILDAYLTQNAYSLR